MHLAATSVLARTHYGAERDTVTDIEDALHLHNTAIIDALMSWTVYLDPDAPESASRWRIYAMRKISIISAPIPSEPRTIRFGLDAGDA